MILPLVSSPEELQVTIEELLAESCRLLQPKTQARNFETVFSNFATV